MGDPTPTSHVVNYAPQDQIMNWSEFLNTSGGSDTYSHPNGDNMQYFQFVAWGVAGTCIAVLGLIGNVLSIFVLCNRRMRSSTSTYLTALSIYDSVVLISLVTCFSLPSIHYWTRNLHSFMRLFAYIQPFAYPIALIAQTGSIYTTVGFTVERYIAVCLPLQAAKMCTLSRSRKSILVIFLCAVIYNIPRMLEFHTVTITNHVTNQTEANYEKTEFGRSRALYLVYFIILHMTIMLIVPFSLLMVLNILLIRAVNRSASTQGRITSRQRHENNLTVMLLSVVLVFLVCQIPSIVDNICMALLPPEVVKSPPFVKFTCISCLMVITNSAINFYLYCVFGRKFRQVFCMIFCSCFPRISDSTLTQTQVTGSIYQHRNNASIRQGPNVRNHITHVENGNSKSPCLYKEKDRYLYKRLQGEQSTDSVDHKETKETVM